MNLVPKAFAVEIRPEVIDGVQTDVVVPQAGVSPINKNRLLINLHGGGFQVDARVGGHLEATPIAAMARIRVVTVDYRQGPENKFPAASEDVSKVYRELLKQYRPENIGIYGCSAGGIPTAQSLGPLHGFKHTAFHVPVLPEYLAQVRSSIVGATVTMPVGLQGITYRFSNERDQLLIWARPVISIISLDPTWRIR